jgi:hypothetical protein
MTTKLLTDSMNLIVLQQQQIERLILALIVMMILVAFLLGLWAVQSFYLRKLIESNIRTLRLVVTLLKGLLGTDEKGNTNA